MKRFLVFLAIGLLALASYLQGQSLSSQAVVEPEMDKLDTKIEDDSKSSMPVEQVAPKKSLFDQALGAATTTAAAINWNNISWDQISQIPYDDKVQLLAWAASQVDTWKDKFSHLALQQGSQGLAMLGDSGWQGALKNLVAALDQVRKSNPETWELARGALVSAWDKFEVEAGKYMGEL